MSSDNSDPQFEDRLVQIEQTLLGIQQRNARVEIDKAWEISWARRIGVSVLTFFTTSAVFYFIGVDTYWRSASIPTLGYLLSTLSIPILKKWWLNSNLNL